MKMEKLRLALIPVFASAIFLFAGCGVTEKSGISNCVVVESEKDFTGEYLKHSRAVLFNRLPTAECVKKDQEIDKGDGPKKGRVRWAECFKGPDCHEAGMF